MNRSEDLEMNIRKGHGSALRFCQIIFILFLFLAIPSWAQKKQLVQVKAFDQQLVPFKNVEVSINSQQYFSIGNKGVAFVELLDTDFPLKSIKIKDEKLETASWNYSKGIIEIIIRTRSYQLVQLVVRDENNVRLPNLAVTFKGRKTTTAQTDRDGKIEIPLALDEKITAPEQFSISQFTPVKILLFEGQTTLIVTPVKAETPVRVIQEPVTKKTYFKNFDLSKLDSIRSLTAFYAIFKSLSIKDMNEETKLKLDAKFNQLVTQLQDSVSRKNIGFIGRISDSSFVKDDIKNLLAQATHESTTLEAQRADFEDKIKIIEDKLGSGISAMNDSSRSKLLSDLTRLEVLLGENENQFYKNQNDYRSIINTLKDKYFDMTDLENRLSQSEAQRLEDQRAFRQKLFITLSILLVFAILILLLIYFGDKLKKQKKELVRVNAEINRINENLEDLVAERTKLLEDANKELDTFLYRASHDLRSPVCSIIGLCNIALHMSDGESKDLVQKVVLTTGIMDKLLKKLSIISEINQPTNFSPITLAQLTDSVRQNFDKTIVDQNIKLTINCPADLVIYSYPNLLETILANLMENAFFYSVLKDPSNATVSLNVAIDGNDVVISIYDNGIGVEESITPKLFDMFFKGTEKSKGHGLGLYIVQKSVQALDGKVEVESELGRFTKFTVQFPLKTIGFETQRRKLELLNDVMTQ
jgi:signal transduction histidine kinase